MSTQAPHRRDGRGRSPAPTAVRHLEAGDKITLNIAARRYWNDTGLHVTTGQRYQLTAHGTWIDFYIPCAADGYQAPRWLLRGPLGRLTRTVQKLRREPEGNWFMLIGTVRAAGHRHNFACGRSREVQMPATGQLEFFANDVPGFYWNNWGSIQLEITRLS